jgi:flagellar hook-basal body complex protein FliE
MVSIVNNFGAAAYQRIDKMLVGQSSDTKAVSVQQSFSDFISNTVNNTGDVLKKAEAATIGGLLGTVPLDEMALAVTEAETSLKTMMSIRDRVINAYQDIIKMPI